MFVDRGNGKSTFGCQIAFFASLALKCDKVSRKCKICTFGPFGGPCPRAPLPALAGPARAGQGRGGSGWPWGTEGGGGGWRRGRWRGGGRCPPLLSGWVMWYTPTCVNSGNPGAAWHWFIFASQGRAKLFCWICLKHFIEKSGNAILGWTLRLCGDLAWWRGDPDCRKQPNYVFVGLIEIASRIFLDHVRYTMFYKKYQKY